MHAPPPFPAFGSEPTDGTRGRVYHVDGDVRLVAYAVGGEALPGAPAVAYVFAFVQGERVGRWAHTADPAVIHSAMAAFRAIARGRPATDAESRPLLRLDLLDALHPLPPPSLTLDIRAAVERAHQPVDTLVLPLRPRGS